MEQEQAPIAMPRAVVHDLETHLSDNDRDAAMHTQWSQLTLANLDRPFCLPVCPSSYNSISHFITTELLAQVETNRNNIHMKASRVMDRNVRSDLTYTEKHMSFPLPYADETKPGDKLIIDYQTLVKTPVRGKFTNYVVLLQYVTGEGNVKNLTLAYTEQVRKSSVVIKLGADAAALGDLKPGTTILVRILYSFTMLKTHFEAISYLKKLEGTVHDTPMMKKLLSGRMEAEEIPSLVALDSWIDENAKNDCSFNLHSFNKQQQRALALEDKTQKGVVLIQGPPGTGKSHIVCEGLLPQIVSRKERVLVLCNSNVAVDALMLKCTGVAVLQNTILRCGFKQNVSDEIVNRNWFAEGDLSSPVKDSFGNLSGSNSNTKDCKVQRQISSNQVIFTTIHFASKEKDPSKDEGSLYWNFDIVILDEAAQLEDSRLMIVLARCPSIKKMVLVGDPKQLQPYVSESLRRQGFGKSAMERIMANCSKDLATQEGDKTPFVMLEEQFRMAPPLRQVISQLYYNNRLKDGNVVLGRGPVKTVKLQPLLVINLTKTRKSFSPMHQSYENVAEAMVVKLVHDFLLSVDFEEVLPEDAGGLTSQDICILTPYNRHKDRLRMLVCEMDEDQLDEYSGQTYGRTNSLVSSATGSPAKKSQAMYGTQQSVDKDWVAIAENIDTVDKFQGSERKVVIISTCVDKNPLRSEDPHFINVACSRAQHLLIVVGNFTEGLQTSKDWQYVRRQAREVGCYLEHSVVRAAGKNGANGHLVDIQEASLVSKLKGLLEHPSKKAKG